MHLVDFVIRIKSYPEFKEPKGSSTFHKIPTELCQYCVNIVHCIHTNSPYSTISLNVLFPGTSIPPYCPLVFMF